MLWKLFKFTYRKRGKNDATFKHLTINRQYVAADDRLNEWVIDSLIQTICSNG